VRTGEVHGFLGPNGAGKSTTLRVLLGLLKADGGTVSVLGQDPWKNSVDLPRRMAYVPGDVPLWPNVTGGEVIDLLGRLRGGLNRRRRDELLEQFDLDPRKKARTYSKGNRQKVALIAALASDAELLLLDEPTSGLDPLMESVFQQHIQEVKRQGRTVLLSSHILAEVEALCDRVSIIRLGRTVESGTLGALRHLTRTSIAVETAEPPHGIDALPGVYDLVVDNHHAHGTAPGPRLGELLQNVATQDEERLDVAVDRADDPQHRDHRETTVPTGLGCDEPTAPRARSTQPSSLSKVYPACTIIRGSRETR